jgi:hypothetical protein
MATDVFGQELVRDVEAKLPKFKVKIVARARERFPHTLAGGYADRDGKHVHAHKFRADGRERAYEFTLPMIKRLQQDRFLDVVVVDPSALEVVTKAAPGTSELDVRDAKIKKLEKELAEAKRTPSEALVETGDEEPAEPTPPADDEDDAEVDEGDEEAPAKPKKEKAKK